MCSRFREACELVVVVVVVVVVVFELVVAAAAAAAAAFPWQPPLVRALQTLVAPPACGAA